MSDKANLLLLARFKQDLNKKAAESKETPNHKQEQQTRRATTTQKGTVLVEGVCRSIFELIDEDSHLIIQGLLQS